MLKLNDSYLEKSLLDKIMILWQLAKIKKLFSYQDIILDSEIMVY